MSLSGVAAKRTLCEVLREINDELQGHALHHKILPKLREAESMGKRMAMKLFQNNKEFDKDWWAANLEVAAKTEMRLNKRYIT